MITQPVCRLTERAAFDNVGHHIEPRSRYSKVAVSTQPYTPSFNQSACRRSNAIVLLVITGGIAWEGIRRLIDPEPVGGSIIMAVAAVGIVVNGVTAFLFMSGRKDDLNIKGAFLHMASDALVALGVVIAGAVKP
jgi:hypothetical protein